MVGTGTVKCAKCGISSKESAVSFHRFPFPSKPSKHSLLRAKVWAKFCFPDGDWTSEESLKMLHVQHKMMCGNHFDESSYTSSDRKRLNKFAVPLDCKTILQECREFADVVEELDDLFNGSVPVKPSVTNKKHEKSTIDSKESNNCHATITESKKPNVVIQEALIFPSSTKAPLQTTEQKRNNAVQLKPSVTNKKLEKPAIYSKAVPVKPSVTNKKHEKPTIDSKAVPVKPAVTNKKLEKPAIDLKVESADKATIAADVYSKVAADEVILDYEGSTDCHVTITKDDKPNVVFHEFRIIPSSTKASLQTTGQKRNNVQSAEKATIDNSVYSNVATEEVIADYEVESADKATIAADVYSKVAADEVTLDYEGSNDCHETIAESEKPNVIHEFVIIPSGSKASLRTAKQKRNNESNNCHATITESKKPNVVIQEVLIFPSSTKAPLQTTEQKRNNEEIDPLPAVLSNMICDNCSKKIAGLHYKCLICVKYIHCHKCEMQEVHPNHYMIRMPKSPQPKVSEKIIEDMCNKFKTTYPISSAKNNHTLVVENILRDNESGRNESTACDSDGDLSEEVKLLINKEVTRVKDKLVDKTNQVKIDNKTIKRKNIMEYDTPKKRKMCIKTLTVNDEIPSEVCTDRNDNIPNVSMKNETKVDSKSKENIIWPDTIATVVTDPTSPGAVNMMLSDNVSRIIIEITRDGEKSTFKYVDT